jgi:kumamolisin
MTSALLALALAAIPPIPDDTPVQLGVSLKLTHPEEMAALRRAQLDPKSPEFRHWLTPQQFGERFGQPSAVYGQTMEWLRGAGFSVTPMPSRAFLVATGTAAQVRQLLGIDLLPVEDEPPAVHVPSAAPKLSASLKGAVLHISGLDTRVRYRHHLRVSSNTVTLGPQDLRRIYGLDSLLSQGWLGQGQTTVVLSTALPPTADVDPANIEYFLRNVSDVRTPFIKKVLPNPQQDIDRQAGGSSEFELDVQMHSVSMVNGDRIILEVAPASAVFAIGAADIANNIPNATAVSISLGLCEAGEQQNDRAMGMDGIGAMHQVVIQGTMEGQTWSAASGDNGADDCRNRSGPTADFPSTIPEMIAAGGSMIATPQWSQSGAMLAYQQETTWNNGQMGGAAGGGLSILFMRPAYQAALSLPGTMRMTPDLALIAGPPAAANDSTVAGQLTPVEGTSVASPLSAGFFALIASRLGCRLGDVHQALYDLGAQQADGGRSVFHDITTGNLTSNGVTGPSAGPGYDMATGWGSLDVAAIAAALPGCPALPDGGTYPNPTDAGAPYDACTQIQCDGGTTCRTLADGPSGCVISCSLTSSPSGCVSGTVCSSQTIYSAGGGVCVPGCLMDSDCSAAPGTVCSACLQECIPAGNPSAHIGSGCTGDSQCPNGTLCAGTRTLTTNNGTVGYCTIPCVPAAGSNSTCSCPSGSECGTVGRFPQNLCLETCGTPGDDCGRAGVICQPQNVGAPVCLPKCAITIRNGQTFDACSAYGTRLPCDVDSGVCGGPMMAPPDAGPMMMDSGMQPMNPYIVDAPTGTLGNAFKPCGCDASSMGPLALLVLVVARRRRLAR